MRVPQLSHRARPGAALLVSAAALTFAVAAAGYFRATGAGTAVSTVAALTPPSGVTVQQSAAVVTIAWNAASLPGATIQGYVVTRSDAVTVCGSPTPVQTLSCTDTNVPGGTFTYTVTAKYHTFSASAVSSPATIYPPSIGLSPSSGHVGDTITLSGSYFPANASLSATYDGSALSLSGSSTTTAAGAIPAGVTFTVPAGAKGGHTVRITAGAESASATFTVSPQIALSPTSGVTGTTDTITASGFAANSAITATFGGTSLTLSAATSSATGGLTATYAVPSKAPGGYTVSATDASADNATAAYTISTASLTLTASSGHVADTVTLTGSTFPASASLSATYDGSGLTLSGTTTTTAAGAIAAGVTFTVPASVTGSHTVQVTAGLSSASATFTVSPQITVSPISGVTGTTDTITATGFAANSAITATFGATPVTLSGGTGNATGGFTATYTVPSKSPGSYTVTATDASSNSASATYAINPAISVTPTSGHVGATITLSGSNFPQNTAFSATYDGAALTVSGTTTTTGAGAIAAGVTFAVPASTQGSHTIQVTAGGYTGTTTFTVSAQISLSPSSGGAGTSATITGTGFAGASAISATFGGTAVTLTGGTSNSTGGFNATYTVPGRSPGSYTVSATDASSNNATATYTVTFGPLSKLVLSAASTNPHAGDADNLTITAQDAQSDTVTSYTGSHNLTFGGSSTSPGGTHPTVTNASGTPVNFGSATAITFTAGIATVSGASNGVMKLYAAGASNVTVSDGTVNNNASPLAVTVDSAGVQPSFTPTCPATLAAKSTTTFTINVPNDAFANPFASLAGVTVSLTLTPQGNSNANDWGFGPAVSNLTTSVTITSGPANNTFTITTGTGNNKQATLTATFPGPFTAPAACNLTT